RIGVCALVRHPRSCHCRGAPVCAPWSVFLDLAVSTISYPEDHGHPTRAHTQVRPYADGYSLWLNNREALVIRYAPAYAYRRQKARSQSTRLAQRQTCATAPWSSNCGAWARTWARSRYSHAPSSVANRSNNWARLARSQRTSGVSNPTLSRRQTIDSGSSLLT